MISLLLFFACLQNMSGSFRKKAPMQCSVEQNYLIPDDVKIEVAAGYNRMRYPQALEQLREALHLPYSASDQEITREIVLFQENLSPTYSLMIDGMLGPNSLRYFDRFYLSSKTIHTNTTPLWPAISLKPADKFAHYRKIASTFGYELKPKVPLLIGLRGVMKYASNGAPTLHQAVYDDSFVLLIDDGKKQQLYVFSGATHPYHDYSGRMPNADAQGKRDVGTTRPSYHGAHAQLRPRDGYFGSPALSMLHDPERWGRRGQVREWGTGYAPVYRDTNQDRIIDETERLDSLGRSTPHRFEQDNIHEVLNGIGYYGLNFMFHPGFTTRRVSEKGKELDLFTSIGSHTARSEDLFLLRCIGQYFQQIDYLLVEASEAVRRLEVAEKMEKEAAKKRQAKKDKSKEKKTKKPKAKKKNKKTKKSKVKSKEKNKKTKKEKSKEKVQKDAEKQKTAVEDSSQKEPKQSPP